MNFEYYREAKERLTGLMQPVEIESNGDKYPLLPARQQKLYKSLKKLIDSPEFADFFEWQRDLADELSFRVRAESGTNEQLRVAAAFRQFSKDTAEGAVKYVRDVEENDEKRKQWLENKEKEGENNTNL